ncbi:MAG: biotin--[acetyl-CoA-carboxylase] ligase, partial [Spirochaetia bacterium]|nr:biotin--[acetyl-CoA-carboxylase] ligase [Spirochaetia bacterium]
MIYDLHHFEEIPSTNDWIREGIGRLKPGTVCVAERQTRGRGRHGRPWSTGAGENLAFSILLDWPDIKKSWAGLAQAAGLCLADVLRNENLPALLKWPNDVTVDGKKIAGILVESLEKNGARFFILGIGLNVNAGPEFLKHIDQRATSMFAATGKSFDRAAILQKFLEAWKRSYAAFQSS